MLPESSRYRSDTQDLTANIARGWGRLWPALDMAALDDSFPRWLVAAAALTGRARAAAVLLAVEYLRSLSDFPPVTADPLRPERFAVAMRVTTIVTVKRAMTNGLSIPEASALAFSSSTRSASRLAMDGGRETVMLTSVADPECRGWQRVGAGSCEFCSLLISRGAVYSEASADFPSHDGCHCSAEPSY